MTHSAAESLERLWAYTWPGNVRELQNVIERAAILADGAVVEVPAAHLCGDGSTDVAAEPRAFKDAEREHILRTLTQTDWLIEGPDGAAALLALAPSTLRSKMKRLGISRSA